MTPIAMRETADSNTENCAGKQTWRICVGIALLIIFTCCGCKQEDLCCCTASEIQDYEFAHTPAERTLTGLSAPLVTHSQSVHALQDGGL